MKFYYNYCTRYNYEDYGNNYRNKYERNYENYGNKDEVNYLYIYTDSNNNLVKVTYDFSNYIDEYTNSDKFNADIYYKVKDEESNIN